MAVSILMFILSVAWLGFIIIGALALGGLSVYFAVKFKRKYNELKTFTVEDQYFDGTKYDYDEDVYYIGKPGHVQKEIGKNAFSKMGALMPTIAFGMLGVGLIILALATIFRMFF